MNIFLLRPRKFSFLICGHFFKSQRNIYLIRIFEWRYFSKMVVNFIEKNVTASVWTSEVRKTHLNFNFKGSFHNFNVRGRKIYTETLNKSHLNLSPASYLSHTPHNDPDPTQERKPERTKRTTQGLPCPCFNNSNYKGFPFGVKTTLTPGAKPADYSRDRTTRIHVYLILSSATASRERWRMRGPIIS